jgi:hypothetical protein
MGTVVELFEVVAECQRERAQLLRIIERYNLDEEQLEEAKYELDNLEDYLNQIWAKIRRRA